MSKTNRIPTRQPDFLPFQIVDGNKKRSNVSIFNVPLGESILVAESLPGADLEYQWSKTYEKAKPVTEEILKDLNSSNQIFQFLKIIILGEYIELPNQN